MLFESLTNTIQKMGRLDTGFLISEQLTTSGLKLSLCDVVFGDLGIYILLPDGTIIKSLITKQAVTQREFQVDGLPPLHLFLCNLLREELEVEQDSALRLYHKSVNEFDITVYSGKVEARIYREKPLEICPHCLEHYRNYFGNVSEYGLFDLKSFLSRTLIQDHYDSLFDTEDHLPLSMEVEEWKRIENFRKRELGFCCEQCGIELKGRYSEYLRGHYSFSKRYYKERMKLLCPACHAKEEGHEKVLHSRLFNEFKQSVIPR